MTLDEMKLFVLLILVE